jgi:hypothetical protein
MPCGEEEGRTDSGEKGGGVGGGVWVKKEGCGRKGVMQGMPTGC